MAEQQEELAALEKQLARVARDPAGAAGGSACTDSAGRAAGTARLHAGDADNVGLWHEFLPKCRQEIQRIYDRLEIAFDVELGESFTTTDSRAWSAT